MLLIGVVTALMVFSPMQDQQIKALQGRAANTPQRPHGADR